MRAEDVEYVCRNIQNRAGVRLLMACLLAKIHNPTVDVRRPYTEIGEPDSFSGIEVVMLDWIGFLRHFLHLFHRLRMQFLEEYQRFVLVEPESAVSQPLKEAFLALRQASESFDSGRQA